jgi:hypothetical protein
LGIGGPCVPATLSLFLFDCTSQCGYRAPWQFEIVDANFPKGPWTMGGWLARYP